jgi:O-antigen ligase/polysaccharide polymerase Wzy-like membrane protein
VSDAVTTASWPRSSTASAWSAVGSAALAALAAASTGAAVVGAPKLGVLAVCALLLVAVISRAPALVFGASLLALVYTPEDLGASFGVLERPELQKGIVYAALLAMAVIRGVDARLVLPVLAYLVLGALSYLHGDLAPGLTVSQMASTFVTLTIGWAAVAVKWDWRRDARYLKVLAWLAPTCVALGVVLQAAGLHSLWKEPTGFDSSWRLRGASIAAQLALMAFGSASAAYVCHRLTGWRPGLYLAAANAVILALTLSRGTAIALGVAAVVPMLRFVLQPLPTRRGLALARLGLTVALVGMVTATLVPRLEERNAGGRYYAGQGTFHDPTSGRTDAWKQFYAIAQQSPLFGHGLGAGPITKIQEQGFLAQHNEYLRMFLEGGYVGGGLLLLAMVLAIGTCIARAPPFIRLDLAGIAVAWAGLSFFDNTLTSINLTIPLCLTFALAASWRRAGVGGG